MNQLKVKDWVCLVDDAVLQAKYAAHRARAARDGNLPGAMTEMLWRQIDITATAEGVSLSLMNVDAEAAAGGYWRGGEACVNRKFTWDDLHDVEFVEKMLAREQVVVYHRVMAMLASLRARTAALREALAAL